MNFFDLKDKNILILGFGKEGQSAFRIIREYFPAAQISVADKDESVVMTKTNGGASSSLPLLQPQNVFLGPKYLDHLDNFDVVIKSPGIPWSDEVVVAHKIGILTSATEIFFHTIARENIIGVTGSKGKSTVSTLIYTILKAAGKSVFLIGNVGNPVLNYINHTDKDTIFIYELSSYQLQGLNVSPHIAVWTTVFPAHLSYHGGMDAYLQAKRNIIRFQKKDDIFIYNAQFQELSHLVRISESRSIPYNHPHFYHLENDIVYFDEKKLFSLAQIQLLGQHNKENVLAAIAAVSQLMVPLEIMERAVCKMKALSHRLEYVGTFHGIDFYNDSIATVPGATISAIKTFQDKLGSIILGGVDNDDDFSELTKLLFFYKVENIVLMGQNSHKIYQEIKKQEMFYEKKDMYEPHVFLVQSNDGRDAMKQAVRQAIKHTKEKKICLLSPAAQSFGLFKNFEERGDLFKLFIRIF